VFAAEQHVVFGSGEKFVGAVGLRLLHGPVVEEKGRPRLVESFCFQQMPVQSSVRPAFDRPVPVRVPKKNLFYINIKSESISYFY